MSVLCEQEPVEAGDPNGKGQRGEIENVGEQILQRIEDEVFVALGDVAEELVGGPIVFVLPDEIGKGDEKGDGGAGPNPGAEQHFALRGNQQADDEGEAEEGHSVFALQREAGEEAEENPQLGAFSGEYARGDPCAGGP